MNHFTNIMNRFLLIIVLTTMPASFSVARDLTNIELKTTHVNGAVYMLEGANGFAGGNIGVSIGEDGILIIDDQFSQMNNKIRAELAKLKPGHPKFVLNTHWHGDHTGGNELFSPDATIIAHHNVRKRLMTPQSNQFSKTPARDKSAWPVITFEQSLSIDFNDELIDVIHFANGHTDGDSIIFFSESNVVHMGDHFFVGMFPFIDLQTGGNALTFADNIKVVIDRIADDVKIIPGHGPLSNKQDLIDYHAMLKHCISVVKEYHAEGLTLKEIQAKGLPEQYQSMGSGFINADNFIMFIYKSLP